LTAEEFEDAVAACNLLPGPASTQLAIFCAWRLRGRAGGVVGGLAFIIPGFIVIVALAAIFLSGSPSTWVLATGAGAGAAVAAIAVRAGSDLLPASWSRARGASRLAWLRWAAYVTLGACAAASLGPLVVLVLLACGMAELLIRAGWDVGRARSWEPFTVVLLGATGLAGTGLALAWTAAKVGALSYGGGFVIIPLMQADAVDRYQWMTQTQFVNAVALGQVTPGPVVLTVAGTSTGCAAMRASRRSSWVPAPP
jgi:chromate transporter